MPETATGRTPLNTPTGLGRRDSHHEASSKPSLVQHLRAGNVMRACNACRQMKVRGSQKYRD